MINHFNIFRWNLLIKEKTSGQETEEIFDAVMVCTGHHGSKHWPTFPGTDEFQVGAQFKSLVDALKALQCSAKISQTSFSEYYFLFRDKAEQIATFLLPCNHKKIMPVSCLDFILLIRENKFTLTTTRIPPDTRARELSSLVSETRVETSQLNLGDVRNRWVLPDTKIVLCRDEAV